jgi:hypothetical protein
MNASNMNLLQLCQVRKESLLVQQYQRVRLALEEKDAKQANKELVKLQELLEIGDSIRKGLLESIRRGGGVLGEYGIVAEGNKSVEWSNKIKQLAQQEKCAPEYVASVIKDLKAETDAVLPEGFDPPLHRRPGESGAWSKETSWINPTLPKESRLPNATLEEAVALSVYSVAGPCDAEGGYSVKGPADAAGTYPTAEGLESPYKTMNKGLWIDVTPKAPYDKTYNALQSAFKKAKPFPQPVDVVRGLVFDRETADRWVLPFQLAAGRAEVIWLKGFLSTSTTKAGGFMGGVQLSIKATLGIDLMPYTYMKHETELLLNHNTSVRVLNVTLDERSKDDFTYTIDLVQVLLKQQQ